MENFFEHHRAEREAKQQQARERIAALTADLEDLLDQPPNADILEKQAITMDALLRATMRDNLRRDKDNGYIDPDNIATALKIQKQCMNTIKAKAAMDYMNALTPPLPSKLKNKLKDSNFCERKQRVGARSAARNKPRICAKPNHGNMQQGPKQPKARPPHLKTLSNPASTPPSSANYEGYYPNKPSS